MAPADGAAVAGGVALPMAELNHILYRVDRLRELDWHEYGDAGVEDFLYTIEQVQRRLVNVQSKVIAVAEAEKVWALDGARSINTWLSGLTGSTRLTASRSVKLSRAIRHDLGSTGEALAEGQIGAEHAHVLAGEATKTERMREQLKDPQTGEGFLVGLAQELGADEFRKAVKHWAGMADPEAADRNWREETGKEEMFLSETSGGYHLSGWFNPASGKVLETALTAQMGRKPEGDDRSPAQRRAAAFVSWAHSWLDSGDLKPGARIRPHLSVHVPFETLSALCEASGSAIPPGRTFTPGATGFQALRGPGGPKAPGEDPECDVGQWVDSWRSGDDHIISTALDHERLRGLPPATLDNGTPLPPSVLGRLACGSQITRVIFGPQSTLLDVGREKRIFPANQVRGIIARDRHCQYPSCTEPPEFGEIHHALWWWKHNGKTSTEQGILLCWHHHAHVHERQITIARVDGAWVFSTDQGKIITSAGSRPRARVGPESEISFSELHGETFDAEEPPLQIPGGLAWPISQRDPRPPPPTGEIYDPWTDESTNYPGP